MNKYIFLFLLFNLPFYAQSGIIKNYYSKGKIKSELSFINDVLEGTSYWYYENGNLSEEKRYDNGKLNGWYRKYYPTGLIKEEMYIKDGYRDGLTKYYYENGGLQEVKNYENGRLIKSIQISYDEQYQAPIEAYKLGNRQMQKELKEEKFLCSIEICPVPIGGMAAVQEKVVYPEHAKLYGLEGLVVVIAQVNKNGFVDKCSVVSGIGLGCDEAAVTAVKNTRFIPGYENGQVVDANVSLKVEFKLSEKSVLTIAKNNNLNELLPIIESEKIGLSTGNSQTFNQNTNSPGNSVINEKDTIIAYMQKNSSCEFANCPIPVGGFQSILDNLIIPQNVKRLKLSGDVVVLATVDEYGNVRDTKVLNKLGNGADEAVEVAILDTHFTPATINGKYIRCDIKITVPIRAKQ